jgi:NAD+ kinase
MLKSIAIYTKYKNSKTRDGIIRLVDEFSKRGVKILIHQGEEDPILCPDSTFVERFSDLSSISGLPDLVLSVGGDGTFLETVLNVKDLNIPIAGFNTGRMGFLANIPDEDIKKSIDLLINGEFEIIERCLLELAEPNYLFGLSTSSALNEFTVQKTDFSLITISVYVDETYLNTYWADGLIISTATGSTAYNLSVGGPILAPDDESIIISPISPHNLTNRPIIIPGKSKLRMTVDGRSNEFMVTCDFRSKHLPFGKEIQIEKAHYKLKTVMLKGTDFFSTLRNKLMWGVDRRN